MPYKPEGYTSLAPYLLVESAERTLAFLSEVFGAQRLRVMRRDDGAIAHAEARVDDTVVMMGEMAGAPPANVHVYVADVDAAFARALRAGGVSVEDPADRDDGDRRGGVRDADGTVWWIATQR